MDELFVFLYEKYRESIKRHVCFMVFDKEVALDITQDAYTKLYSAMKSGLYKEKGLARAFLYTLATNLSLNYLHCKHFTQNVKTKSQDVHLMLAKDECDIHRDYCDKEKLLQVIEIVNSMSKNSIIIFNLRYFEDLTYDQIVDVTKIPLGKVKYNLNFIGKILERKGFEVIKHKKFNKAKNRKEISKKRKLLRGVA